MYFFRCQACGEFIMQKYQYCYKCGKQKTNNGWYTGCDKTQLVLKGIFIFFIIASICMSLNT